MTGWDVTVTNDNGGNWHFQSKNSASGNGTKLSDFEYDWINLSGSEQYIDPELVFNAMFENINSQE